MSSEAGGILFDGVGKTYRRRGATRRTLRSLLFDRGRRPEDAGFTALGDVAFAVPPGTSTGLVGGNGAGKSTLLRLAAGLTRPSEGRITVPGDTISVLGLGGSFDTTLSGAENALTGLVVNGLSRSSARRCLDAVREFSELGDFFDRPVRTYSSGMGLRLAFAVAAQLRADAFLVDEVLSVGDLRFQERCVDHLRGLRGEGATILMASHDLDLVEELCDQVVWMVGGRVRMAGTSDEVIAAYRDEMRSRTLQVTPMPDEAPSADGLELRRNRYGSQEVRIESVLVNGRTAAAVSPGDPLRVDAVVVPGEGPRELLFDVCVRRSEDGLEVMKAHTLLGRVEVAQPVSLSVERLDAAPGEYQVDVGVYPADWSHAYDFHWGAYPLRVEGVPRHDGGLLNPPMRWGASAGPPGTD